MTTLWIDRLTLDQLIGRVVLPSRVVLDIGCGIRPQWFFRPEVHVCCEPHPEYLERLKQHFRNATAVLIPATAQEAVRWMPDKSVDSIYLIDVIEHFEKQDGLTLLRECERIARHEIVVFTPLGYMPQDYTDGELDAWGLHGTTWQIHRSGWLPDDLGPAWHILGADPYHSVTDRDSGTQKTYGAFWAIRRFDDQPAPEDRHATSGEQARTWPRLETANFQKQLNRALRDARRAVEAGRRASERAAGASQSRSASGAGRLLRRLKALLRK